MRNTLLAQQPPEQAGFWKAFSTVDHIHTVKQIMEKYNEYSTSLYIGLIDCNKAFDSIKHEYLLEVLKNQGTPSNYTVLIEEMYTELKARIKTDTIGEYFSIKKGVRKGDPLSPILFNSSLEEIFRNLEWEDRGLNLNGKQLINLRFAYDIVLFSQNH